MTKRFTLRSKSKVDGQWELMTLLRNLARIHRFGAIGLPEDYQLENGQK